MLLQYEMCRDVVVDHRIDVQNLVVHPGAYLERNATHDRTTRSAILCHSGPDTTEMTDYTS